MALSQKHRSSIYTHLTPIIGEEEAEALLSHFPARDLDEPVTKEFVRAEIAEVRTEIAELRGDLETGVAGVRTEIAQLRGELQGGLSSLEARISERFRQQTIWLVSAVTIASGLAAGLGQLLG